MITFEKSLKLIPKLKIEFSHDSAIRLDFYSKFSSKKENAPVFILFFIFNKYDKY